MHREKGEASHLEWFRGIFDHEHGRLLDIAAGNLTTLYGAYESGVTTKHVSGLVVLIRWVPNDWYNFGYKDMDEVMGPFEYDCPQRIYDLLTPTDNEHALEWRAKVRERLALRRDAKAVKPGDRLRFAEPLSFTDGTQGDTFEYVGGRRGRNLFKRTGYYVPRVTIRDWRTRPFENLGQHA